MHKLESLLHSMAWISAAITNFEGQGNVWEQFSISVDVSDGECHSLYLMHSKFMKISAGVITARSMDWKQTTQQDSTAIICEVLA